MLSLSEIQNLLRCTVYDDTQCHSDLQIRYGCASDLMSDVLAFSQSGAVLLTGLVHPQTIQTAFIAEIAAIVFVRGKQPSSEVVALARERRLPVMSTPYSMYEAAGKLYAQGLVSTMVPTECGAS
jgi:predicted transcriptional regulator